MSGKAIPLPEGYIVWRDNKGRYHVARRPDDIHQPMPSRTRAVQWLWGQFGREYPSGPVEPDSTTTVWHTHFGPVEYDNEMEEHTHDDAERNQPTH